MKSKYNSFLHNIFSGVKMESPLIGVSKFINICKVVFIQLFNTFLTISLTQKRGIG